MADQDSRPLQLFARLLDGKSATLTFSSPQAFGFQIKQRIHDLTGIPTHLQRLICSGYQISDAAQVSLPEATLNLVLRLKGGKGGFGSLLRGAATKAGQKKTNNFDACRDMSGRRLRHVNAEKKLEEWKAEEEERRLEKLAAEFLKKQAKKGKQGVGEGEAAKYVEKYREESAKCIEAVELALKESFQNGKRKAKMTKADRESEKSKRLKIWMGKKIMGDSDGDDSSDEEGEEEDEKSVVLDKDNQVFSDKDTEGSSSSVMGNARDGESSGGASCESGSEEEKDSVLHQSSDVPLEENTGVQTETNKENVDASKAGNEAVGLTEKEEDLSGDESKNLREIACQPSNATSLGNDEAVKEGIKQGVPKEADTDDAESEKTEKPLEFNDFNSAADMEVLGMERLKAELQARGLKCGGTLQERAARLFLLKSTPLNKIPKKLLAKK